MPSSEDRGLAEISYLWVADICLDPCPCYRTGRSGPFLPKISLPIDGSGQRWPWHVFWGTTLPLNFSFDWLLFLSFCFTHNSPWFTDYSPSHTLFLLLALSYHTFFFLLNWDAWHPWIFCSDSGWPKQIGFFCSVPHVKSHKGKGSILKSTQEIFWFYWLNHAIYNM